MSMTREQVIKSLDLIGGKENIFQILINNGRRVTIQNKEDYDSIEFLHSDELLVIREVISGVIKVKSTFPYSIIESIMGFEEGWVDPMVIDNKWREVLREGFKDVNGVIAQAEKERDEQKNLNSCEHLKK